MIRARFIVDLYTINTRSALCSSPAPAKAEQQCLGAAIYPGGGGMHAFHINSIISKCCRQVNLGCTLYKQYCIGQHMENLMEII